MTETHALTNDLWQPFASYGFTHPFWAIETVILRDTWIVLGILAIIAFFVPIILEKEALHAMYSYHSYKIS